jgi:hypothetical protein
MDLVTIRSMRQIDADIVDASFFEGNGLPDGFDVTSAKSHPKV